MKRKTAILVIRITFLPQAMKVPTASSQEYPDVIKLFSKQAKHRDCDITIQILV